MSFGDCCNDLTDAMQGEFNSHFYIGENDALFLAIGHVATEEGAGWFDQAVFFCPFCGTQLQTREEISGKAMN